MTAIESIGLARTRIAHARELLSQPSAQSLEECRELLGAVAQLLQGIILGGPAGLSPEVIGHVRLILSETRAIEAQIEYGSRFCLGYLQTRMGVGYTDRGGLVMHEAVSGGGHSFDL